MNSSRQSTGHNGFPLDVRLAAEIYIQHGLEPIPIPLRSKNPGYPGWESLRVTEETLDLHFPAGQPRNIGVLNGAPSGNSVDVDLDSPEARLAAPFLLPHTGWIFGRASAPQAHWLYQTDRPFDSAQLKFIDLNDRAPIGS